MIRPLVTSVQNQRVKDVVKLRDRKQREKQGKFLIDGAREIERALDGSIVLIEVFTCEELCHTDESRMLIEKLRRSDIALQPCTPEVFAKLAFGDRAEGVLAVAATPNRKLSELTVTDAALITVLVGLEKPGNVGAVLRSADAAGVSAVIIADGGTDLFNPNCIRSSLGTIFTLPVCEATSAEALTWLRQQKLKLFATRVDGAMDYTAANFLGPAAIVLGSEAAGLSHDWSAADISAIKLPMHGAGDSLNVSATAAVLFYEALRQRP